MKLLFRLLRLLSHLPLSWLYAFSTLLAFIVQHLVGYRKKVVETNVKNAFPQRTTEERKRIVRDFYHFFADYIVETLKLLTLSPEEMRRRMTFSGLETIEEAVNKQQFAFIYLGHYGNWEWISSLQLWVTEGVQCAQLYRPLNNKTSDAFFLELRSRFGSQNIPKNEALRRILTLRKSKQKTIVGFISDQSPRPQNIHDWVRFLHQDTPVFTGTERIAKKINAAVFFGEVTRPSRGHYHCHFHLLTDTPQTFPDYELTELYMHTLETLIEQTPALWLWSHKRWKHQRQAH